MSVSLNQFLFKFIHRFTIYLFLFLLSCETFSGTIFLPCEAYPLRVPFVKVCWLIITSCSPLLPSSFHKCLYVTLVQNSRLMIVFSTLKMLIHFLLPWSQLARILEWEPFLSSGDLPHPGIKPEPPALKADSLPSEPSKKPNKSWYIQTMEYFQWLKEMSFQAT